jgi:SOS response regulatory protein OraA/RecX
MYLYALKLLRSRDQTVAGLCKRLEAKFGEAPPELIEQLSRKNFLNDRRFAENYVARRKDRGRMLLREELIGRGIAADLADDIISRAAWPSLREAMTTKIKDLKLRTPLQSRDAARLFRALARLGYDEDAIQEEIDQLHEQ